MSTSYLFGLHSAKARLEKQPETVQKVYLLQGRQDAAIQAVVQLANTVRVPVQWVSRQTLEKMSGDENHQGVLLEVSAPQLAYDDLDSLLDQLTEPAFLLVLDGVQDPHNLGACLRSADAAGVHAVVVPKDNAVSITPTVSKVACGAAETVPFFQVTNLARTLESLQQRGIWIYGLAGEAKKSLYQMTFDGPIALVMGAEGKGLRQLTKTKCDELLYLPMKGSVESLNVSVATGISLFEVLRQRG